MSTKEGQKGQKKPSEPPVVQAVPQKSRLRENVEAVAVAVVLAMFIRSFIVQPFKIPSGSMIPTLLVGDHIFVNKFLFGIRMPFTNNVLIPVKKPQRGDIVVFKYPEDPKLDFIKRVIAVPGETLEIINRNIFINGKQVPDPHGNWGLSARSGHLVNDFGPITLPASKYFVMGDNRNNSHDSRFWGFVDFSELRGKAFLIYWSWDKENFGVRWGRIAHGLH